MTYSPYLHQGRYQWRHLSLLALNLYNKKEITRWLEDMNFYLFVMKSIFYLFATLIRINCFHQSKIKCICSRHRVIPLCKLVLGKYILFKTQADIVAKNATSKARFEIEPATSGSLDKRSTDWVTETADVCKGILKIIFRIYTCIYIISTACTVNAVLIVRTIWSSTNILFFPPVLFRTNAELAFICFLW